jgi:hypothetical protein
MEYKICEVCGRQISEKDTDEEAYECGFCDEHWTNDERLDPERSNGKKWIFKIFESYIKKSLVNEDKLLRIIDILGEWSLLIHDDRPLLNNLEINIIFEYDEELKASILLASQCFYKQAMATLRNVLEIVIRDIYFIYNENEYQDFCSGKGKNYFNFSKYVNYLSYNHLINEDESNTLKTLWERLSETVHSYKSNKSNMAFSGVCQGGFDAGMFNLWYESYIAISKILLKIYEPHYKHLLGKS